MAYGDIRDDWKIQAIERKADQAVGRLCEIDNMRTSLDSLVHTVREISSDIARLCSEYQTNQEKIDTLERRVEEMEGE